MLQLFSFNISQFIKIRKFVFLQSAELKEVITDEYLPWVAQYLVMKRASIEHNFHTLYSSFIDQLAKLDFSGMVIKETYRNIKVNNAVLLNDYVLLRDSC